MSTEPIQLFKGQMENESKQIAMDNNLSKRGDYLIWWYFMKLHNFSEAQIEDVVCDGGNELGIDAIFIDDESFVHFYQFKNPEKSNSGFKAGEVDKVLSGLELILQRKHKAVANEALKRKIDEIHQSVRTGYRIHLVTSGEGFSVKSEAGVKLDAFVERWGDHLFSWQVEDLKYLWDSFYRKNLPTIESEIRFCNVTSAPYQVRFSNHDCYMFHADGTTLADLYKEHGELLLQQNIRVDQGVTPTNTSIKLACGSDDSANFFHYNNGITFLCEEAKYDPFQHEVTLQKAQIVNGGQTTRALYKAYEDNTLKRDVYVPMRVITSRGDKEFGNNVTVNLNNQNRVKK